MSTAVKVIVRAVELCTRPVKLRLPFRFGSSTLRHCPQLFVRAHVEVCGRAGADGFAAEMMVPKWFDKRAAFGPQDNVRHLALAASTAAQAYVQDTPATAFGLFDRHYGALLEQGRAAGLTELSTAFGQAVIDRAIVDAMCRALRVSFFEAMHGNLVGLAGSRHAADMGGWDWSGWLASLRPLRKIEARHTVGLLDPLETSSTESGPADGLPVSLRSVVERYGHRAFKIKLGGDPQADLARLRSVLGVLDEAAGNYAYTLDGNEQYAGLEALEALLAGLVAMKAPLYVEQPLPREMSLSTPLPTTRVAPMLMDEADAELDSFARGRPLGWTGVSSKACKGIYKSLINRARCERWNRETGTPRYFMSAEDLTCQAGLAVQQDLALVSLLGIAHSERNGHHYGGGFGDAPSAEQHAFCLAHPDLYELVEGQARLRIHRGELAIDSLFAPGYAHLADPDWQATQPLASLAP